MVHLNATHLSVTCSGKIQNIYKGKKDMCCENDMDRAQRAPNSIAGREPAICGECNRPLESLPPTLPDLLRDTVGTRERSHSRNNVEPTAVRGNLGITSHASDEIGLGTHLVKREYSDGLRDSHTCSNICITEACIKCIKHEARKLLQTHSLESCSTVRKRICHTEKCSQTDESVDYARISLYGKVLQKSLDLVKKCGFYHGSLSMENARRRLKRSSIGSFLLRDSSDTNFVLSLSIKTNRGTTSIRIRFEHGLFRLDCEDSAYKKMPSFPCILKLVEHYVESGKSDGARSCVFLESTGRKDTPVLLTTPYRTQPTSLKHLARLQLNQMLSEEQRTRLMIFMAPNVENYLQEYPYKV